jgi:hypothetical protein
MSKNQRKGFRHSQMAKIVAQITIIAVALIAQGILARKLQSTSLRYDAKHWSPFQMGQGPLVGSIQ